MDVAVTTSAVVLFIASIFSALVSPILLGKERQPYTKNTLLINLVESIMCTLLAGRIFGWW